MSNFFIFYDNESKKIKKTEQTYMEKRLTLIVQFDDLYF